MIAEDDVEPTAGRLCLALQPHDEIEHAARVRAAVDQVPEAHEMRAAARPAQIRPDDPRRLQQLDESGIRPVHVAEGDDARHVVPAPLLGPHGLRGEDDRDQT